MNSNDWSYVARDGLLLALAASIWVVASLRANPRLFLRHYPAEVRAAVAPATKRERTIGALLGLPLFAALIGVPIWSAHQLALRHGGAVSSSDAFLAAFAVGMIFNGVDWLVLDELWLGVLRPRWAMIPGTDHVEYHFDHARHFRGFVVGTVFASIVGLVAVVAVA